MRSRWIGDLFAPLLLLVGCGSNPIGAPTGIVSKRSFDFVGFERVEVSHAFDATVREGKDYQVDIEVDEAVFPALEVVQRGTTLFIGLKSGTNTNGLELRAFVAMPVLKGLKAGGAAKVTLENFVSEQPLELDAGGASEVEGNIDAGDTTMTISGASTVRLVGHGGKFSLVASGASNARLDEFRVEAANVNVSGASEAMVRPQGLLDADASGGSEIRYFGDPPLGTLRDSGGSSIEAVR